MQILLPLVILFAFFWFFVLLPQRRRQRVHREMQDSLAPGNEVITAGGLHGNVVGVEDSVVRIEVAPAVVVRVDRRAVAARVEPQDYEPEPAEELEQPAESASPVDGNPG